MVMVKHLYINCTHMNNILTHKLSKHFLPEGQVMSTGHSFDKANLSMLNAQRNALALIAHFFSPIEVLAGRPVITVARDHVVIHVFYYVPSNGALNNNTVNNLGDVLSSIFGRPVELRLVKLHYPYMDSYILAQYIAMNTLDYTLTQIVERLFGVIGPVKDTDTMTDSNLPSHIVGIKVRVSGRLMTERSQPRKTVQSVQVGSFSKDNMSLVDMASYSTKNKKGAFTVKVWISQRATA
jgi:hypothetical protein